MNKYNILFICGSLNQTKMMHSISSNFKDHNLFFTPYFANGIIDFAAKKGLLDFTPLGGNHKKMTLDYLTQNNLTIDFKGLNNEYDLIFTCSDLIVQKILRNKKVILVQEGMTDPENIFYYMVKYFKLPRWIASTSTTGMSDAYNYFCVASEGYLKLFVNKGIKSEKIRVTGIPNFDNIREYVNNDFPHRNFVLVATSDARETFKFENRKKFILDSLKIAGDKKLIFKLHPNENVERATAEIKKFAPDAIVYSSGNINHMIANCDILLTKYSTVVYVGIALGKQVYSYFNIDRLKLLLPIQNGGLSAYNISRVGYELLNESKETLLSEEYETTFN